MKIKIRNIVHDCELRSDDGKTEFFTDFINNGLAIEHLEVILDPRDGLPRVTMRGYLFDSEIDVPDDMCGIKIVDMRNDKQTKG